MLQFPEDLEFPDYSPQDQERIIKVREWAGYRMDCEQALHCYNKYREYRDEGQSHAISLQYAGI